MKQQVLSHFDLPWLPLIALILFAVCFIAYCVWTWSRSNKEKFEQASLIPLEEPMKVSSVNKGHTV